MKDEQFANDVYSIVSAIPYGKVLSYGMIAAMLGRPQNARLVGKIMSYAPRDLTSHRVVSSSGRTVPCWESQRAFLEAEGVTFKANGHVDMKKHLWVW